MLDRRDFLRLGALAALTPHELLAAEQGVVVNDVHSQLNRTVVHDVVRPKTTADVVAAVRRAKAISICGGRHSMGGQQFGAGTTLIDVRSLRAVHHLDRARGLIEVGGGIQWPELIDWTVKYGGGWSIAQKQTGADALTIAGALGSNVHGRGLTMKPFVSDVEAFTLVDAAGRVHRCSREENVDLFRLAIGGYGLFGVITSVALRLVPRKKLRRVVEIRTIDEISAAFDQRIRAGFLYGDFQFAIDPQSDDFLRRGVFSCYEPVESGDVPAGQKELAGDDWRKLLLLAHASKSEAYQRYAAYYMSTNGQIYWSDVQQLGYYAGGYHRWVDQVMHAPEATEIITELYVPRPQLAAFMAEVAGDFRANGANVIYGTVRLIERDDETFLPWAKQPYACVVINLHTQHTPEELAKTAAALRQLIDRAAARDGSFYLTYHRFATKQQLLRCYPQFPQFLALKRTYDPHERFSSDWYRHHKALFA
jgi:FAD/FMN-containing dehydrogenase